MAHWKLSLSNYGEIDHIFPEGLNLGIVEYQEWESKMSSSQELCKGNKDRGLKKWLTLKHQLLF